MKHPFFSVIIPTKNRCELVGRAIQSVLLQTDPDFEVVLVDNDDSNATHAAHALHSDARLRYFRTGGLTMPDNWEFGYTQATGEYFLLLEDKSVLKPRALATIRAALAIHPCGVVSWPQDLFNDLRSPPVVLRGSRSGDLNLLTSDEVLELMLSRPRGEAETKLPRGLNSAISRDLAHKIRSGPVGRLCPPVAPDFTFAFLQLTHSDQVLHIDDCLTVYGSCFHSLGRTNTCKQASDADLKKDLGVSGAEAMADRVPIPGRLASCWLYNDFLRLQETLGGRLARFPLRVEHFLKEYYRDIEHADYMGADTSVERLRWSEAVSKLSEASQREIRLDVQGPVQPARSLRFEALKGVGRKLGIDRLWRALKVRLGVKPPDDGLLTFANPLDFVIWEARRQ